MTRLRKAASESDSKSFHWGIFPMGRFFCKQHATTQTLAKSSQAKPLNPAALAPHHKFLDLEEDAGRHLPRGKLRSIVFCPGKLANAPPVLEDLFKTSAHVSPTLFAHRLVS